MTCGGHPRGRRLFRRALHARHLPHDKLRIHKATRPFQAPVEMRSRGPAGGAHRANNLALFHPLARLHVDPGHMHKGAFQPVPVVEENEAAFEIHVGFGKGHDPGRRGVNRRARGRGDVNAGMGALRLAVEDSLGPEHAGDDADDRPVEAGEPVRRGMG